MSSSGDAIAIGLSVMTWIAGVPVIQRLGALVKSGNDSQKLFVVGVAALVGVTTTPFMARVMGWNTREERLRGMALSIGVAQLLDGFAHMFKPDFYSSDHLAAHYSTATILIGAGFLGIASVYT